MHLYPFNKSINVLYFSLFVVSVLFVHFHFTVVLKSLYLQVLACETKDIPASVNETLGTFPSTSNFKRPFVIDIFNLYFKPHDALKRIFLSFLSGENHWEKCERSGKRMACGLRWKTNKPSIKRQLGSLRKQRTSVMPPLVCPQNDIWEIRTEIPYWCCSISYNKVVLLIGHAMWETRSG